VAKHESLYLASTGVTDSRPYLAYRRLPAMAQLLPANLRRELQELVRQVRTGPAGCGIYITFLHFYFFTNDCTLSANDLATLEAEVLACFHSSSTLLAPNSRDSLSLPVELWSTVWLHLPFPGRVATSQTCRQWRTNALACQELWKDICLHIWDDTSYNCAMCHDMQSDKRLISATGIAPLRLKYLLERSGNRYVSLSVILRGPLGRTMHMAFEIIARVLVSHAQRVRSLNIHASVNACIPKLMRELPTLYNMEYLKASSLEYDNPGFVLEGAMDAPCLERAVIYGPYLSLASPDAVEAISLPSLKTLQCNVSSAEELVNAVRIAATGALKSLHICLSCFVDEDLDFTPSPTDLSLICSLLEAMPVLSITIAKLHSDDERLVAALAQLKVNRITFQADAGHSDFDGFIDVLSSLPAPNELLCSRVEAADGGDIGDARWESSLWSTFSVIDTDWNASRVTGTVRRHDLQWNMDCLQYIHVLWDALPNNTYQSLRVMTIDSDFLEIFQYTLRTMSWPNVHTVTVKVVPEGLRLASPADVLPMLDLPALTTLNIEASLTKDNIWLDIEVFRHSILLPILGDRTVKLMLFTGITLHSAEVPVQLSELAGNAEVIRFE